MNISVLKCRILPLITEQVHNDGSRTFRAPNDLKAVFLFWYDKPRDEIRINFGDRVFHVKHLFVYVPCQSVWEPNRATGEPPRYAMTGKARLAFYSDIDRDNIALEIR